MFEMRQISTEFKWQLAQIRQCWRWAQIATLEIGHNFRWCWVAYFKKSNLRHTCLHEAFEVDVEPVWVDTRNLFQQWADLQVILSASRIPPGREGLKKINLLICIEYGWLIDVLHLILVQIVDSLGTADNVDIVSILDRWKSLGGKTCFEIWGNGELSYA